MEEDTQRALQLFYAFRKELVSPEEAATLKEMNKVIAVLESSFFRKIMILRRSLEALKTKKNLGPEDVRWDEDSGEIVAEDREAPRRASVKIPPVSHTDLSTRVKVLAGNRDMVHIQINKTSPKQTLGFSIKASSSVNSNGIFVEDVTSGGLADKCGIRVQDQILSIDGVPLDNMDTNREVAVNALKGSSTKLDLFLAREKFSTHLSPSREVGHLRNRSEHMFPKELNTEWTQYEIIELKSVDGSFGFGIMGGLTCDVMVRTILSGGAADKEGGLQINDHIMYINEESVRHMTSIQVAEILKRSTNKVTLIVARPFNHTDNSLPRGRVQMVETSQLDATLQMVVTQLYGEEYYDLKEVQNRFSMCYREEAEDYSEFFSVELATPGCKLGLTIVDLYKEDPNHLGTLEGIFIKEVMAGSIAQDHGIRRRDRLLKINDVTVDSSEIQSAMYRILNTSGSLRLDLQRYISGPTHDKLLTSDFFSSKSSSEMLPSF